MTKFEELINKHCPNGFKITPLWSVTIWDKKFNNVNKNKQDKTIKYNHILADELKQFQNENGTVKILTTSITNLFAKEDDVCDIMSEGEVVCIPWGGNPVVQYYNGKFITGDNRIATSIDKEILDNKYLYYWMQNNLEVIKSFYRGSGIKHPDMSKVLDLIIVVPPLEVQREIVRVLDSFTFLSAELSAELQARKKQYEYYRELLLTKKDANRLGKIIDMLSQPITDGPHITPVFVDGGIPFLSAEAIHDGKIDFEKKRGFITKDFDLECCKKYKPQKNDVFMVKSGSTTGKVGYVDTNEQFNIWSPIAAMRTNVENSSRFLFHLLQSNEIQKQVKEKSSHGSQPNLSMRILEQFEVVIPPLEIQNKIADVLDNFDAICNDLNIGLPAEIEARQKQYEYYRDMLLTFAETGDIMPQTDRQTDRQTSNN